MKNSCHKRFESLDFSRLTRALHHYEKTNESAVDSFPVSVCDTPRITRARIFQDKEYHGYNSSKQRYFYGIKVHMLVSVDKGVPIEVVFTPGLESFSEREVL